MPRSVREPIQVYLVARERALRPFPVPARTPGALHLASMAFLRERGREIRLASYDERMAGAAPAMGVGLMEGAELAQTREDASLASAIRDPSLVASAETVEQTELNGEACWQVKLTWKSGRESFDCYSVESGLMVGSVSRIESPMGTIEVVTLLEDYREFGGLRIPTRMTQQMLGQEQVMIIENVDFPTPDDTVFDLPPEIQALVRGR